MRLFSLLILIPTLCFGYNAKDVNLSDYGFQRYVRPQLISITQDYYTLLTTVNPEFKELKSLNKIFQRLRSQLKAIQSSYRQQKFDVTLINLGSSLNLLRQGMRLLASGPDLKQKEHFSPEDSLVSFDRFFQLRKSVYQLYMDYENIHFFVTAKIEVPLMLTKLNHQIDDSYNMYNILLLESSDVRFQNEFTSFWSDFIKPINNLVLPNHDKKLFISKLNDFNLRLNILNVVLTKRNKRISKQTQTLLKIMHNRWNNILKVTLKR